MSYRGKSIQVAPGLAIGFDEHDQPQVQTPPQQGNGHAPDIRSVVALVGQDRERLLQVIALYTAWMHAVMDPPESRIVVAPAGAMPRGRVS